MNETWFNDKGNLCVRIEGEDIDIPTKLYIILGILISSLILICWKEWIVLILLPILLLPIGVAYRMLRTRELERDQFLLSLLKEQIDVQIKDFISKQNANIQERKRSLFYQTQGTYGIVKGVYILCLLSDSKVVEYELLMRNDGTQSYYELSKDQVICTEDERLRSVVPYYRLKKNYADYNYPQKTKIRAFVLGIIFISFYVHTLQSSAFVW